MYISHLLVYNRKKVNYMIDVSDDVFSDLFPQQGNIFRCENLLSNTFVPKSLIARDKEVREVAFNLSAVLRQGNPGNMYIWGDTGAGKTITVRYVLNILADGIKKQGKNILVDVVTLDCTSVKNEIMACTEILGQLSGVVIRQGLQFNQYLREIWDLIDKTAERYSFYTVVVFFDEIDKFNEPDNILYQLSRALSHQKIKGKNVAIEIILASNQKDYLQKLDGKVLSSAAFHYCNFPDYNEEEIFQIIQMRREAFLDDAVTDDIFRYCAKKIADKYHGDARRAIDTIYEAGKIALFENSICVTKDHIDAAENVVNTRATTEMLQKISAHDRYLILSIHLASMALTTVKGKLPPHSGIVNQVYKKICKLIGDSPNCDTHVSHRLGELGEKQLIHKYEIRGHGNTRFFSVTGDIIDVMDILYTPLLKAAIVKNYADIESIVLSNAKVVHKNTGFINSK
jgi:cell division control protein 6